MKYATMKRKTKQTINKMIFTTEGCAFQEQIKNSALCTKHRAELKTKKEK